MNFYRGSVLVPAVDGFEYIDDAAIVVSDSGVLEWIGRYDSRPASEAGRYERVGLILPPLVDCHIHVPQFPIRGRFLEGVEPPGGLLEGLARNVYPAEMRCSDLEHAIEVSRQFLADTQAHGTLGGVAYMTSHPVAARAALQVLPESWRVGLVLMDQNCPPALRITASEAEAGYRSLARDFGDRVVITDRFAVACSSPLRQLAGRLAGELGLTTQTHLSEQPGELAAVRAMYAGAKHYTDVYDRDGLLRPGSLLAHCIHLSAAEWEVLAGRGCVVCHCPVSNSNLSSGTLDLRPLQRHSIGWALCTDVGASASTSLLDELRHFVSVHAAKPWASHATVARGLWHASVAARDLGRVRLGGLRAGGRFSAVEFVRPETIRAPSDPETVVRLLLDAGPAQKATQWWR
jgi:guanine deaminase